jgi:hypothetical protein
MRGALTLAAAVAVLVPAAALANQNKPVAADQAMAKAAVLKLADLPNLGTWKKAKSGSGSGADSFSCAGYHPKESDLVTTGQAKSSFTTTGTEVDSEVDVLKTKHMVDLDWQRTFTHGLVSCLRTAFEHGAGGKISIVSLKPLSFPKVGSHTAAYRIVYGSKANGQPSRGVLDFVVITNGRAEISLILLANLGAPANVATGEKGMNVIDRGLAGILLDRTRAGAPVA